MVKKKESELNIKELILEPLARHLQNSSDPCRTNSGVEFRSLTSTSYNFNMLSQRYSGVFVDGCVSYDYDGKIKVSLTLRDVKGSIQHIEKSFTFPPRFGKLNDKYINKFIKSLIAYIFIQKFKFEKNITKKYY